MIRALALLLALSGVAEAQQERAVIGLSQSSVSITTDFAGSEILVYGAVKRDSPMPDGRLEVIVTVEGPSTPLTVRRKDKHLGIWVNAAAVVIDSAPSFYAISTTGPLDDILTETENLRHRISIPRAIRAIGISAEADDAPLFLEALLRLRLEDGRYHLNEGKVSLTESTLFRADVKLPANLTEGEYRVRVFLTREGEVVDMLESLIAVRKEGLERLIYTAAHEEPLLYGILSLVLAVAAGWGASTAFRLVRL